MKNLKVNKTIITSDLIDVTKKVFSCEISENYFAMGHQDSILQVRYSLDN